MNIQFKIIKLIIFVSIAIIVVFPLIWILILSLKTRVSALSMPPELFFKPTLKNFNIAFFEKDFGKIFLNSIIIATSSTVLSTFIGVPAAYSFSRKKFFGRKQLFFTILTTRIVPPMLLIIPFYIIFSKLELIDNYISVILSHTLINLSFVVWIMHGFFKEVPLQYDEIAMIDGETKLNIFCKIIIPLVLPGLLATSIFAFATSWNEFLFALILTGFETRTFTTSVPALVTPHGTYWGQVAVVAFVAAVPMIIFGILIRKYIVREFTFGLIK